jgi:4a-hydroxytetrahydrobiopterin dehydratase
MDMLSGKQIAEAGLADWRKLAQGFHARYLTADFGAAARFITAISDLDAPYPSLSVGDGFVDLKLISADAVYRDGEGTEHIVEWVTQNDVDAARRISAIAVEQGLVADPASVSVLELGLDTGDSAAIAPVWAALLTGRPDAQGHGSPSDEIRDADGRVPNLWFGDAQPDGPAQRFHIEVYVAAEDAERRVAAAVAAGGRVVDDSDAPAVTVIADQDGNTGALCVA